MTLEVYPAAALSAIAESQHIVGAPGEPAFQNGWAHLDAADVTWRAAKFQRDAAGMVTLTGVVYNGTGATGVVATSTIFTLPAGYRPTGSATEIFGQQLATVGYARIDVNALGQVYLNAYGGGGANGYVTLAGIRFQATPPVGQVQIVQGLVVWYGATPPVNPQDGWQWVYPADPANGVNWVFRYRAGQTLPWELIGGSYVDKRIDTDEPPVAFGAWTDCTTPGPLYVLPRIGDYEVHYGFYVRGSGTGANGNSAIYRQGDSASTFPRNLRIDAPAGLVFSAQTEGVASKRGDGSQLQAGDELRVKYFAAGAGANYGQRFMRVRAVRVA